MIIFVGFFLTFLPQFVLGYHGMPRRYYHVRPSSRCWNVLSTAGASILGVGYVLPLFYLLWSLWLRQAGRAEPLARHGPGVANAFAAADRELRRARPW